jgi:hypothetical protein
LDAVDLYVLALTSALEHVVERVAGIAERVGPVGDDDRRVELHALSIALVDRDRLGSQSKRYLGAVAHRPRVLAFGSAAALVVAGSVCAALVSGLTGEVLAIALITLGLGAVVLLIFLEVGLSEERELAREEKRRQRSTVGERRLRPRRLPRRPG